MSGVASRLRQICDQLAVGLAQWRTVIFIWFANVGFCAAQVLITSAEHHWTMVSAAAIGGFSFGMGLSAIWIKRYRESYTTLRDAFEKVSEFNSALLHNRVRFIMEEEFGNDDDARPTIN